MQMGWDLQIPLKFVWFIVGLRRALWKLGQGNVLIMVHASALWHRFPDHEADQSLIAFVARSMRFGISS